MSCMHNQDSSAWVFCKTSVKQLYSHSLLQRTKCSVHTFDCTSAPKSLDASRHMYHEICLSKANKEENGRKFMSFSAITQMLGHKSVDLLKMDIEGFEYELFTGFSPNACDLPRQICFEAHRTHLYSMTDRHDKVDYFGELYWARHQLSVAEMALFYSHMGDLGYGTVSVEHNSGGFGDACCSEYTVVRVEQPVHC